MKKLVLTTIAAIAVIGVFSSTPAEARCWWNGWYWQCWQERHHGYWRHHHHHHRDWRHHREGWDWRYDHDRRHRHWRHG